MIEMQILGLSSNLWIGALLGAIASAIFWVVGSLLHKFYLWWITSRPSNLVLGDMAKNDEQCLIFMRHLFIQNTAPQTTPLFEVVPRVGTGRVPNVGDLCPDVDATTLSNFLNVLGQAGKKRNIRIIRMSEDKGEWNGHIVVIGGQSQKSVDFYRLMQNVFYKMDNTDIRNALTNEIVPRENGYGYGLVLKAQNPQRIGKPGIAVLIGGFGTLGTEAASYYLREHLNELGKEFGPRNFGIVVRASISAGVQSVERLSKYDQYGSAERFVLKILNTLISRSNESKSSNPE